VHIELNFILLEFYLVNHTGGIGLNGGEGEGEGGEHLLEAKRLISPYLITFS
jgi:hypothetical protein